MQRRRILVILVSASTTGCVPLKVARLPKPTPEVSAEVLIFREWELSASGIRAQVGVDGKTYCSLGTSQYSTFNLSAGDHEFFVRSAGGEPSVLKVSLGAGTRTCMLASPNPTNYGKALTPLGIAYAFGQTFLLTGATCPSAEVLPSLEAVSVEYESQ